MADAPSLTSLAARAEAGKKPKRCKWCDQGWWVKPDGNHWVVKSIIPARIDIIKCRASDRVEVGRGQ